MIVVVGGIKGGSGKTTIATNLTVLRSSKGKKVLLVDADEQKSATDWADQRVILSEFGDQRIRLGNVRCEFVTISLAGKGLFSQLQQMKKDYDDIIVDVGGRDTTSQRSALSIADIFLIPFKPRSLDIWTIGGVKNMIAEIKAANPKLKCFAIINQADSKGSDNDDALDVISECEDLKCLKIPIGQRKAFSNAAADGLGVSELKTADKKAIQEMKALYDAIYSLHVK